MKIEIFQFVCINGHKFSAPSLGETAYGEFLLWSINGELAYLNAFEDPTYKAVESALQVHPKTAGLQRGVRARILQQVYGPMTCDPDGSGCPFQLNRMCPCPVCNTQHMVSWGAKTPPEVADIVLNPVTHTRWAALSEAEKALELDKALARVC